MKVRFVPDAVLPGSFVITAETPEEMFILRVFCADKHRLVIDSYGGNIREKDFSMLIKKNLDETNQ